MARPTASTGRSSHADRALDQTVRDLGPADATIAARLQPTRRRVDVAGAARGAVVVPMPDAALPRYCAALNSAGSPCKKAPLFGSTLCRNHRGNTSPQRANSSKRIELRKASVALQTLGIDASEMIDPRIVLLQAVSVSHQTLNVVLEMMRSLGEDDLNSIGEFPMPGDASTSRGARAEAFFHLLNVWTDRAAKVSRLALQVGLEDRMVHLAEVQAAMIVESVRAAFLDAAIPDSLQAGLLSAIASRLKLVSSPSLVEVPQPRQLPRGADGDFPASMVNEVRHVSPTSPSIRTRDDSGMKRRNKNDNVE